MANKFNFLLKFCLLLCLIFFVGSAVFALDSGVGSNTPSNTAGTTTNSNTNKDDTANSSESLELLSGKALRRGSTGDDVVLLQKYLKQFPAIYPEGLVTGFFGPLTYNAVKKFQAKNKISADGVVGPRTRETLYWRFSLVKPVGVAKDAPVARVPDPTEEKKLPDDALAVKPESEKKTENESTTNNNTTTTTTSAGGGSASGSSSGTIQELNQCPMTLASGNQTYYVRSSNMPQIMQFDINPLDALVGASQSITIKARDTNNSPITSVTARIIGDGDTEQSAFPLTLQSGTDTNGTWSGSWTLVGSRCENFMIKISARSGSGTSSVDVTLK